MPKYIFNQKDGSIYEQPTLGFPNKNDYPGIKNHPIFSSDDSPYANALKKYNNHLGTLKKYSCLEALKQELEAKQKAEKEVLEGYDFYVIIGGKAVTMEEYQKTIEFQQSERRLYRL